MKKIIMTGGGTAGHITPNIAIMNELDGKYSFHYIGSKDSMEKQLIEECNIPFYEISSGKLRRSINFKNVTDMFRVVKGSLDALILLRKIKPDLVFSKGGFVTVPVILASTVTRTPVVIHESDLSIGLANKLSIPQAKKVCVTFEKTANSIDDNKAVVTGAPLRNEILQGDALEGKRICNFKNDNPVLLVMGGSLGSVKINTILRENLHKLKDFNIIHLCGKNNLQKDIAYDNYIQFEFLGEELPHILAYSNLIVSRAGSNAIFEILSLKKPNLLIPLSKKVSRGDQIQNAKEFEDKGYSMVLDEDTITDESFVSSILDLYKNKNTFIKNMNNSNFKNGTQKIIEVIENELK